MSYCRFTENSDVYAYECDGGVQFWVAGKANRGLDHLCNTYNEAYQYAKSLRDEHGLDVPDYAIEALRFDALEEVKRFNGPNSAVAELQAENAKLQAENKNLITNYEMLSAFYKDSRQACEHLFIELKRYKSLLRAKLPERELMLIDEIKKLMELVHKQDALTKAVHAYWAGSERSLDEFNAMMDANAQVLALMRELGIEVPE